MEEGISDAVSTQAAGGTELVPYEPGLPLRDTVMASLTKFFPGAATGVAVGFWLMGGGLTAQEWIAVTGGAAGIMTAGYALGLELLRRRLYPDAQVGGRRSVVAGLMAPLAAFVTGTLGGPALSSSVLAFVFLPSLILAVLMFFAWLIPTPEEMRGPGWEAD